MPELPEVETVRRGVRPHIEGKRIVGVHIRQPLLRWPITEGLAEELTGATIKRVERRGKYLLITAGSGTLMIHLGMSGRLFLVAENTEPAKHDHVDFLLNSGQWLRFSDPRRFGAVLFEPGSIEAHPLLNHLGPEPLSDAFDGDMLHERSRGKTAPIKSFIMDSRVVVGVGNIYANEALFLTGIRPTTKAGKISRPKYRKLATSIVEVLAAAIEQGGTTLRDFVGGDGKPGYFSQKLHVYGRAGQPCTACATTLKEIRQNNRSSVYCPACQR